MKRISLGASIAALVPAVAGTASAQSVPGRAAIDRISRSVVRIVALERGEAISSGSGTIVSPTGRIYTNRHLVVEGDDFEIQVIEDPNERPVPTYRAHRGVLVGRGLRQPLDRP